MKVVIKMSLPLNYAITVSPKKNSDQILPKHPHQLACSPTCECKPKTENNVYGGNIVNSTEIAHTSLWDC